MKINVLVLTCASHIGRSFGVSQLMPYSNFGEEQISGKSGEIKLVQELTPRTANSLREPVGMF